MTRVAVFGLGYVGSVTTACLCRAGHTVVGVDIDADKVAEVNAGKAPVHEPGLAELIAQQVRAGRLSATVDSLAAVHDTDLALVCVGTPSGADGQVSSAAVERVIAKIGRALRDDERPYTVAIRSTLLPGLLEERLAPLLRRASHRPLGENLRLCNNPEFLREATALQDYAQPPFVVVGAEDETAAQPVLDLYAGIEAEKIVTDTRTAALVKYACNAFHALKITFANEVGALAKTLGADGLAVMDLLCRDHKLNLSRAYLRPGFAFGGSCLPKDVRALCRYGQMHGLQLDLLNSLLPSNTAQIRRALRLIEQTGQRRIGLVGLSFKAGTDDLRESPLVILAEALLGAGYDVRIFDPHVQVARLRGRNLSSVDYRLPHLSALLVDTSEELFAHAELLVLGNNTADTLPFENASPAILDLRCDLAIPTPQYDTAEVELSLAERLL
jgi:GDP-mannose 6-dehydrogenase